MAAATQCRGTRARAPAAHSATHQNAPLRWVGPVGSVQVHHMDWVKVNTTKYNVNRYRREKRSLKF